MYCKRRHECEAYKARVEDSCTGLVKFGDDEGQLPAVEPVARGYPAWKEFEALSKRYKALMNEVLDEHGEFESDGCRVVRTTTHPKAFDAQKTLPIMEAYGIEDPASCFKVAVGPLEKAVKGTAEGAGAKKGAHYAAFLQECEDVEAMTYGTGKSRREKRI